MAARLHLETELDPAGQRAFRRNLAQHPSSFRTGPLVQDMCIKFKMDSVVIVFVFVLYLKIFIHGALSGKA